jgi:hypothetical protein
VIAVMVVSAGAVNVHAYWTRHTFMSCCLQAQISLATIAAWCGTSIQMISETYGRMIRRYEGLPALPLDEQMQRAKVEAMSLLSARRLAGASKADGSRSGSMRLARPRGRGRQKAPFAGISPT